MSKFYVPVCDQYGNINYPAEPVVRVMTSDEHHRNYAPVIEAEINPDDPTLLTFLAPQWLIEKWHGGATWRFWEVNGPARTLSFVEYIDIACQHRSNWDKSVFQVYEELLQK